MSKDYLDEREFELVNIIGKEIGSNQRDISRHMNLSLGMVNMLIRRMISKGYIRIKQLDKRKVEYLLTPKGFAEKMQKSVKYTLNTINAIGMIKDRAKEVIEDLYKKGHKQFFIYSESDLMILVDNAFKDLKHKDCTLNVLKKFPDYDVDGILLIGKEKYGNGKFNQNNRVDLISEISKKETLSF